MNDQCWDNIGRRFEMERRKYSYSEHIPERRSGKERRKGKDRRQGSQGGTGSVLTESEP